METITDILCNKCGESVYETSHTSPYSGETTRFYDTEGLIEQTVNTRYGRKVFTACSTCLKEFMSDFKIPAQTKHDRIIG